MSQIVDHEGHIAIAYGRFADHDQPVYREARTVSRIPTQDYANLLGCTVDWNGNHGVVYHPHAHRPYTIDATDWQRITVETPIPMPRNGREYGWKWECGQWVRDYFPRCAECYHYHDPAFPYCEKCWHCHRATGKCKEG